MSEPKQSKQNWTHLAKPSCDEVSDPSEMPVFVGN